MLSAAASPSVNASSVRPSLSNKTIPNPISGPASITCTRDRSASDPIIQKILSAAANGLRDKLSTSDTNADANAATATPAKINGTAPDRSPASNVTSSVAATAPSNPRSGNASGNIPASPE